MSEALKVIPFEEESPEIKDRVEKYWTKRAVSFFEQRKADIDSQLADIWSEAIIKHLPTGKDIKILDVGCGAGFFPVILGKRGYNVTGIDLTGEMIKHAERMIEIYGLDKDKVKAIQMDAENPEFPDGEFDVIVSRNLTWTLPHPIDAYRQWARVLKKGGILLNFDAEYAKYHHDKDVREDPSHREISAEMNEECHKIYHMLTISSLTRPEWDAEVLVNLGFKNIELDIDFSDKAFADHEEFRSPQKIFMIKATKA